MPVQPIDLYQQQPGNSLVQILQGGGAALTHILDNAIQIGRDVSNKRTAQEQDMMSMRNNETALAQRRAENLQQSIEDAQKFAFTRQDADRRFSAQREDTAFEKDRANARDMFDVEQSNRNYALAAKQADRNYALAAKQADRNYALGLRQENRMSLEDQTKREQDLAIRTERKNQLATIGMPGAVTQGSQFNFQAGMDAAMQGDYKKIYEKTLTPTEGTFSSPERASAVAGEAEINADAALKLGDPTKAAAWRARELEAKKAAELLTPSKSSRGEVDPEVAAADREYRLGRVEKQRIDAAKEYVASSVLGAPGTFGDNTLAALTEANLPVDKKEAEWTAAQIALKDDILGKIGMRPVDVLDSIRMKTEDEFVKSYPQSKRPDDLRKIYRETRAKLKLPTTASTPATPAASGGKKAPNAAADINDWINRAATPKQVK